MNDPGRHDKSLERIRSRARELLISGGPDTADAEALAAFVDGTLSLDEISDASLGRWIDLFGSNALIEDRLALIENLLDHLIRKGLQAGTSTRGAGIQFLKEVELDLDSRRGSFSPEQSSLLSHTLFWNLIGHALPSDWWVVTALRKGVGSLGASNAQDRPMVALVSPSQGFKAAPTNTRVNVLIANFQGRSAFVGLSKGSTSVPSQCSLLPESRGIRIVPDKALDPNSTYNVTIGIGSTKGGGDTRTITLLGSFGSSFSTGTQPIVAPPEVVSVDLKGGAVDTPTSTKITVRFTSPMDAVSFDQTDVRGLVLLDSVGKVVPSTIRVSYNLKIAFLTPINLLASGVQYTVQVGSAVTDLAGNPLAGYTPKSFTTR